MSLVVRNTADNSIIHENSHAESDFHSQALVENTKVLDLPYARAEMTQWYFEGIRMGYSDWQYKDYVEMEWHNDLDIVHLSFNLKGKTRIHNYNMGRSYTLGSFQHNMMYANGFHGTLKNEELREQNFMIQLTKPAFLRLTEDATDGLKRFGEKVMEGKAALLSDEALYIDIATYSAIREVINCRYGGGMKKLFLLSKCMELLVLQAEAYQRSQQPKVLYCKTDYDKERILFARDYLVQHVELPPSLSELARVAGINEFKLKRGFKEIFNNTVFGYLSDYRLATAKEELMAKKKSASEIAFDLGYSSLQHFSAAFRKKYGISPRQLK